MQDLVISAFKWVWRRHFHIPEPVYWLALIVCALLLPFVGAEAFYVVGAALILSIALIARWHWDRSRAKGGIAVPYLRASAGAAERAEEVQRDTVGAVLDRLPVELEGVIHPIPVVVGPESRRFARRLRRRLRARFLLYGRITVASDGNWSVFPRILGPSSGTPITHIDPHTRELSVQKASWDDESSRLPATLHVTDEEYPHAFCDDLAAVLRGILGQAEIDRSSENEQKRVERAESLLEEAIAIAPESTSRQVDRLRVDLSFALRRQDRQTEALDLLRKRVEGDSPSPELLRAYFMAVREVHASTSADVGRAVRGLETALEEEGNPLWWDLTLFNLINQLIGDPARKDEGYGRLDDFRTRFYQRRWYVQLMLGARAWYRAEDLRKRGRPAAREAAAEAAHYYSRAIRRRWRHPVLRLRRPFVALPTRRPSPILYANLVDAHRLAGQHRRGRWNERRFHRVRKKFMLRAFRLLDEGDLQRAYALLDWALVGRKDEAEASGWIWKMIVMRLMGDIAGAEEEWKQAKAYNPMVYIARAYIWQVGKPELVEKAGMPGSEPLSMEWARRKFGRTYKGPPLDDMYIAMP